MEMRTLAHTVCGEGTKLGRGLVVLSPFLMSCWTVWWDCFIFTLTMEVFMCESEIFAKIFLAVLGLWLYLAISTGRL